MRESLYARGGAAARSAAPLACTRPHRAPRRLLVHHLPARTVLNADGLHIHPTPDRGHWYPTVWFPSRNLASHVAAAAAAGDGDGRVLPDPSPQPRGGTACYLQVVSKSTLHTSRIPISAPFAEELVGHPVGLDTGEVPVPVHLDGCRPRTHVPASCTIGLRLRDGRPVGRYVAGLGAFLRGNGAAAESTLLLLTAVAPGPAAAARELAAELIHEPDVGPGAFWAMHDHVTVLGPWQGTPEDCNAKFLQQHNGKAARTLKPRAKALSNPPPAPPQQPPSTPSATSAPALPPPPSPQSPRPSPTSIATNPDALVLVRKMRKTTLSATRVTVRAEFAEELAGGPVDAPGHKVTVPIHQTGSEPQAFLPGSCHISVRSRAGGTAERVLGGLSAYLRNNGAVADSTLLWLAAVPADPAHGHDRPSLQVRLINEWDMEPAAFNALHSFIGRAGSWSGRYKHYEPFLAAEVQRVQTRTQASDAPAGAALPLPPLPPLPAAAAGPVQRSPKMERLQRVSSPQMLDQRLGMLPEGLAQVHVDAIRSYLQPSALQIKAVHLPHRALGNGVVSVHQAFANACGAKGERGTKPEPVAAAVWYCYPQPAAETLGHLVVRGSPRQRADGCIDWAVTGLRAWLHGVGAAKGDLLLLWVMGEERAEELEEGQGGKDDHDGAGSGGAVGLGVHLMRQEEVGLDVLQAVWQVVAGW